MKQLWHNPRCSKSRQALALLTEAGVSFETRLYLKEPPSKEEVAQLAKALGLSGDRIIDMVRTNEKDWAPYKAAAPADLADAIAAAPILLQRPIFVVEGAAVFGRPPEAVLTLL